MEGMDERSVSPVIGTVLLIAITIVIVGIVAAFIGGLGLSPAPIHPSLTVEGDGIGSTTFLIKHMGGDTVAKAFGSGLGDMDVRINGASVKAQAMLSLNGEGVTKSDFESGDLLWVIGPELKHGDMIMVIYEPTNQTLLEREVRTTRAKTLPPSCVLEHRFEEGSGTIARDTSGNGNDGTLIDYNAANADGDTPPIWVDGKFGGALSFDGVDDYVKTAKEIPISGAEKRTLSFWTYVLSIGVHPHLTGWGDQTELNTMFKVAISAQTAGSGTWLLWGRGGGNDWDTKVLVKTKEWMFHTITYDGTKAEWFINGASLGTFTHTYNTTATTLEIGLGTVEGQPFNGLIDEVRIYNRALTPA